MYVKNKLTNGLQNECKLNTHNRHIDLFGFCRDSTRLMFALYDKWLTCEMIAALTPLNSFPAHVYIHLLIFVSIYAPFVLRSCFTLTLIEFLNNFGWKSRIISFMLRF